jgi:hypothetical protein
MTLLALTERDLKREAGNARDNKALAKVFADFRKAQTEMSIDGETVEIREAARAKVITLRLIEAEIEVLATLPDK